MPHQPRILILTAGGPAPSILINAVAAEFSDVVIIEEASESRGRFLRRRARLIGWVQTIGQLATMVLSRLGKRIGARSMAAAARAYDVDLTVTRDLPCHAVDSANGSQALALINDLKPDAVLLVSCRLLSARTLTAIPCPVLNFHPGITPEYRGMWGGYWARAARDAAGYGATVHLVTPDVDEGPILYQQTIAPLVRPSIFTDPVIQAAAASPLVLAGLRNAVADTMQPQAATGRRSRQYFHPPVWSYLWRGVTRGIW
ncbi:formyl transferase [Pseudohoeflea coraliihabitans]|uniref:phosphoribosylglycinamide formyltransferase 1 n=1 Tax=Pseudohoeflea coraliihabitans TaxID=2860393 RepID=A0ABS6WIS8_9HYPH|nr:formyl transferase [Pseudohoeflea sp. DP4N28-3]MBW3095770.1 formyl transferase [Pseudohoeflea sp. DP4N28-3]